MSETEISTRDVLEWIFQHPKRKLAFGKGTELDIAYATTLYHTHAIVDLDGNLAGAIFYERDDIKKMLTIKHIIAERIGFKALVSAWEIYFPDYTVQGKRSRSSKLVKHKLSDFVK